MKLLIAGPLLALLAAQVQAAGIAMEDQSQIPAPSASAQAQYFKPPAESELPDNAYGKLVREAMRCSSTPSAARRNTWAMGSIAATATSIRGVWPTLRRCGAPIRCTPPTARRTTR